MIKVVAKHIVKKEKVEEFITLAAKLEEATNKNDEGCIHYALYQDVNNPQTLTFIEEWESKEALKKHMDAPHFQEVFPLLGALLESEPDIGIYKKA
ncbi:MAG TPA: putative quinol monooxygenase [Anaerovoracaceae bacterium]|nr:putative quinol monooxygenase [Anaerovoracaceae bacterium]